MLPKIDLRNAHKKVVVSEAVKTLQGLLLSHGYGPANLTKNGRPDGAAGAGTAAAVHAFQRASGLTADYIVGPATWRKLLRL